MAPGQTRVQLFIYLSNPLTKHFIQWAQGQVTDTRDKHEYKVVPAPEEVTHLRKRDTVYIQQAVIKWCVPLTQNYGSKEGVIETRKERDFQNTRVACFLKGGK